MRSFTLILALLLSQLLAFVPALARPRNAYRSPTPTLAGPAAELIAARQHHAPRALLDVCAYIGADVGLGIDLLGIDLKDLLDLQICLCLSALPLTLDANAQVKVLGDKYGMDLVNVVLRLLINTVPSSKHCTYPDNCTPSCEQTEPCGFHCKPPYVKQGNQCVCPAPYVSCNGQCLPPGTPCGSAVPKPPYYRRSLTNRGTEFRI
ncbi:hypothetical protein PHLGIDRAFT_116431 [Phlebiopsis gigantea 11061_1 CR5-6]|uniref:Uncharacterized protein n=1 Tax=Phlebiopsis gigantea (strain 11061_1 CR5-6) TaxID=745531 RepID=A0A0C3NVF6_PHLG1|nr:hypothetical protein PHLGIDRAFT_116431 [Phlebiopsis gigantea 11061_1 CR5-6]